MSSTMSFSPPNASSFASSFANLGYSPMVSSLFQAHPVSNSASPRTPSHLVQRPSKPRRKSSLTVPLLSSYDLPTSSSPAESAQASPRRLSLSKRKSIGYGSPSTTVKNSSIPVVPTLPKHLAASLTPSTSPRSKPLASQFSTPPVSSGSRTTRNRRSLPAASPPPTSRLPPAPSPALLSQDLLTSQLQDVSLNNHRFLERPVDVRPRRRSREEEREATLMRLEGR